MNALGRLYRTFREEGVASAAKKILRFALYMPRRLNWHKNLYFLHKKFEFSSRAELFNYIYKKNIWFSRETKSGYGSTLVYTESARKHIPAILSAHSISSVYDAPCGDFNWMRLIINDEKIDYLGADIVPDLIDYNRKKFSAKNIRFTVSDIIADSFPTVDLWICRDCFIHFSNQDILSTLEKFCESGTKFVLTTNFINDGRIDNKDIPTGHYRLIDLFSEPFNFTTQVKYRFVDYLDPDPPREMILLSRDDIMDAIPKMRQRLGRVSKPVVVA